MSYDRLNKVDKWIRRAIIIIGIALLVSVVTYIGTFRGGISSSHNNWGQFGDFIGGIIGSLISLFAVILLYFTYDIQREELSKSSEALDNQNEQMKIQQFENIVFKLIDRKDSVLNDMHFKRSDGIIAVKQLNDRKKKLIKHSAFDKMRAIKKLWSDNEAIIWPFFNSVISTIDFIRTYDVNEIHRARLTKIYFSYFTMHEIILLDDLFKMHMDQPNYIEAIKYFNQNASKYLR